MGEPGELVKAYYAHGYTGWVEDLGDGTCKLANSPLLGEGGPECGDRVDLFYDPCDHGQLPRIGYRIYPEFIEVPGRNFGIDPGLTEEEKREAVEAHLEKMDRAALVGLNLKFADNLIGQLLFFMTLRDLDLSEDLLMQVGEHNDHMRGL